MSSTPVGVAIAATELVVPRSMPSATDTLVIVTTAPGGAGEDSCALRCRGLGGERVHACLTGLAIEPRPEASCTEFIRKLLAFISLTVRTERC